MKKYIIKKGHHFCSNLIFRLGILLKNKNKKIEKKVIFTNSCLYKFNKIDPDDGLNHNYDVNKLFGISLGLFNDPLSNSFRFGWNCEKDNGKVQIYYFNHSDEVMEHEYICDIDTNKEYIFELTYFINRFSFRILFNRNVVGEKNYQIDLKNKFNFIWYLRPYFGGIKTAQRDMVIFMS